jgi:hypothetical protein
LPTVTAVPVVLQFPCASCEAVFPAQDLMEAHARIHSQRNKCATCAQTFPKEFAPTSIDRSVISTHYTVLWIRNYFVRIRIPFSAEFWIWIRILLD